MDDRCQRKDVLAVIEEIERSRGGESIDGTVQMKI